MHYSGRPKRPEAGNQFLDDKAVGSIDSNYHFEEIVTRVGKGPVNFTVLVQLAESGDVVDDATIHWPEERTVFDLGRISLTSVDRQRPRAKADHLRSDPAH